MHRSSCNLFCCNWCPCLYALVGEIKSIYLFIYLTQRWQHCSVGHCICSLAFTLIPVPSLTTPPCGAVTYHHLAMWRRHLPPLRHLAPSPTTTPPTPPCGAVTYTTIPRFVAVAHHYPAMWRRHLPPPRHLAPSPTTTPPCGRVCSSWSENVIIVKFSLTRLMAF